MPQTTLQKQLAETLRHTFGDILDLPMLEPKKNLSPSTAPPAKSLATYEESIRFCQDCGLHIGRGKLVFGRGHPQAAIAFVGDFPSAADDSAGEPFSDEAGDLLNKMILAMKLRPEECYLTNAFKCRPPANQKTEVAHWHACEKHLREQFAHVRAPLIVAMGDSAARSLARSESPLPVLRRQTFEWEGRKVICTWHPRDLLQDAKKKKEAWDDLQRAMRELGHQ
jgi:uracil-DNA glycosylase family 4